MTETKHTPTLEERVQQFMMMELPGQPMMMHMGTSYLVNDLWSELSRLRNSHTALVEALEPFAKFADALNDAAPDNTALGLLVDGLRFGPGSPSIGDLRRARAALSAEGEKDAPKDELSTLRTKLAEAEKALATIYKIAFHNHGRQDEKMADIEPISRAALSSIRGEDQ